jgi:acetyltransferase-like isoleucine patch superfamily enzyme
MSLGLTKFLRKVQIARNLIEFKFRNKTLGFENANAFLRRLDKNSMTPIINGNFGKIGLNCDIEAPLIFHNCRNFSNLCIGNNVHIGKNCFIDLRAKVTIEDNVVISMQTTIITHQDLNKSELRFQYPPTSGDVVIRSNSYIGANTLILQGVEVGENSIVAAGSVVIKNVPPYSVVAGIPARKVKSTV